MKRFLIALVAILALLNTSGVRSEELHGVLRLDTHIFNKTLNKFQYSLVYFEHKYPNWACSNRYGDMAKEWGEVEDLNLAEVRIKEEENQDLAKRYGLTREDLPEFILFEQDKSHREGFKEIARYDDQIVKITDHIHTEPFKRWVRANTPKIYISLPGCLEKFDNLAQTFIASDGGKREELLKEGEELYEKADNEVDKSKMLRYIKLMRGAISQGNQADFFEKEIVRTNKLLEGRKVSEEKKDDLKKKLNVIESFRAKENEEITE